MPCRFEHSLPWSSLVDQDDCPNDAWSVSRQTNEVNSRRQTLTPLVSSIPFDDAIVRQTTIHEASNRAPADVKHLEAGRFGVITPVGDPCR